MFLTKHLLKAAISNMISENFDKGWSILCPGLKPELPLFQHLCYELHTPGNSTLGKKLSLPANSATYAAAVEQKNGFDILYFSQSISLTLLKQKESKKATRIAITFESYIFPPK